MQTETLAAVAVDLGASSMRYATGTFDGEKIAFDITSREAHAPILDGAREVWDWANIRAFVKSAATHADSLKSATIGIDSWGVDHGFIGESGELLAPPVCYRDPSHQVQFELHRDWRERLFELTGIQHQPFNTIYQLSARLNEDPRLPQKARQILLLPDLAAFEIGADAGCEITHASTTQLLGLNEDWCKEAFELCGWPNLFPKCLAPGEIIGSTAAGTKITRIAGHDTASAVLGLGSIHPHQAFLNLGSWSILGCLIDDPIVDELARVHNFSNERAADGRIRFLKNIPGFYVVNRLHDELGISYSVSDWLARADLSTAERIDLFDSSLFNPSSMLDAVSEMLEKPPTNASAWAGAALTSMCQCVADQLAVMSRITGMEFDSIRVSGGGSKSRVVLQAIADACARNIIAGPEEATVLGNLGLQYVASGAISDLDTLGRIIRNSIEFHYVDPRV